VRYVSNVCGKHSIVLGIEPFPVLVEVFLAARVGFVFQDAGFSSQTEPEIVSSKIE
jgi:hypothetical protein